MKIIGRMTPEQEKAFAFILAVLNAQKGETHSIKGKDLLYQLRAAGIRIGDRSMRKLIERHCPKVCFTTTRPGGYFIPEDGREAQKTVDRIEAYIRGLAGRRKAILEAYPDGRQMSLGI